MLKVKICGITNHQDALMATELGADSLGFIFAPGPRRIDPETARRIISSLPPFVQTVGVFVDEDTAIMQQIVRFCGLNLVQLHGDESPEVCRTFMPHTIKAFRLKDESSLGSIMPYHGKVRAVLFDTFSEDKRGGTGKTFDWDLAVKGKQPGTPVILSGGLGPANIERAVSVVKPYAVDVNSGIEASPGKKSPDVMKKLMKTIRRIDAKRISDD